MAPAMNAQPDVNQPRTSATDSRALQNLIKAEKTYVENLFSATSAAMSASSSLRAWGLSETPDMEVSTATVAKWLEDVATAQRTHGQAIDQFREALKDVLDREHSIRGILRDREILISRVIKGSKRKLSRWEVINGDEEHQARLNDAQRELHACEQLLSNESALLVGVKRRTFKEALAMRVKTMGDTGAVMMDSARAILLYLDEFDANVPVAPVPPAPLPNEAVEPAESTYGAPYAAYASEPEVYPGTSATDAELPPPPPELPEPLPDVSGNGSAPAQAPTSYVDEPEYVRSPTRDARAGSVQASSLGLRSPPAEREAPVRRTRKTRSRAPSDASRMSGSLVNLPQVPGGVPSAPRVNFEHMRSGFVAPTVPGGVPTAPRATYRATHPDDSSDEDEYARRRHARHAAPSTETSMTPHRPARYQADSDSDVQERRGRGGSGSGGGFFSRMSNLFRTEVRAAPSARRERSMSHSDFALAPMGELPKSRPARDDSSDEMPQHGLVRHVNERPGSSMSSRPFMSPQRHVPGMRRSSSAMSRPHAAAPEDDELMAAVRRSVIGAGIQGTPKKGSRPPSRTSSLQQVSANATRTPRRSSMDAALGPNRPGSATSGRKVRTRSSSEQLAERGGRRKRDGGSARPSHPPPAPSSFYVGFSNNPAKFATDSWVTRAEEAQTATFDAPATRSTVTTPARPASEQGFTRPPSVLSPSSTSIQPAKSALKNGSTKTPKRLSLQEAPKKSGVSLDLDSRFDGTGHIDFELADMISTGTSPTKETPAAIQTSDVTTRDEAETERPEGQGALAPPFLGLPSFNPASASHTAVHRAPSPVATTPSLTAEAPAAPVTASPNTRKSVRIDSDAPVTHTEDNEEVGGGRARSSWNTRIGSLDDSSDEETESGNPDGYNNARKAFGSATRHLGMATGTIPSKPKSDARKKKSKGLDYNPSVQLPPGLQSIARSHP